MNANFLASLKLMGMGMAAIFFVIIAIYAATSIMLKATKKED